MVLGAAVGSALWASFVCVALAFSIPEFWWLARVFDVLRIGAWLAFLLLLLGEWPDKRATPNELKSRPWRLIGTAALLTAAVILPEDLPWHRATGEQGAMGVFLVLLGISVTGLH